MRMFVREPWPRWDTLDYPMLSRGFRNGHFMILMRMCERKLPIGWDKQKIRDRALS
jgi:hypothetical protein